MLSGRGTLPALTTVLIVMLTTGPVVPSFDQTAPSAGQPRIARDFQLDLVDVWTVTDIELQPGERVVFTATGNARCSDQDAEFGPGGLPRAFLDLLRLL